MLNDYHKTENNESYGTSIDLLFFLLESLICSVLVVLVDQVASNEFGKYIEHTLEYQSLFAI